jgi:hypothetical protein
MMGEALTHAEHFRWMEAVLAHPALTSAQKTILVRLALYLNIKSGRCDPSIESIAAAVGVQKRAVQMAITTAQALGLLTRHEGGGRSRTNNYSFHLKEPEASTEIPHSGAPFAETLHSQTANGGVENGARRGGKPRTAVHPNTENRKNTDYTADFSRWYAIYPKHRAPGKARQKFERIVGTGKVTVEELIAGATRYAAERLGQDWQYTKDPATWLGGECWLDEAAPKAEQPQSETMQRSMAAGGRGRDPWL